MSIKNAPGLHPRSKSFVRTALRGALSTVLFAAIPALLLIACPTANAGNPAVWSLVWGDEFDGPNGSAVDSSKWSFDIGGDGVGNNELCVHSSGAPQSQAHSRVVVLTSRHG